MNSGKCCYRFFHIFLDILHKMKENLGQERVKLGLLSFQGKNFNNFPDIPEKMTVFPVLTQLFQNVTLLINRQVSISENLVIFQRFSINISKT